ncbi:MAG TPA: DNA repair protein RecO [Xanthomonadales bacterium]|nr:DNA repair protein RecO [Xanthomonadales bacterium]
MRIEHQPAYILHERPYRETSLLIEALTRDHGRVGLVARGVRAAKPRIARGVLAPLVSLELDWQGRGELGTLVRAEAAGPSFPLAGEALMCALYVNELLTRLLQRQDPHPEAYERYGTLLRELAMPGAPLGWVLRRFERDLLGMLGYALDLAHEADTGVPIAADDAYSYDPERGPVPWTARPIAPRTSGAALLALAEDAQPPEALARELRRLMRSVLLHHLGGRELNAWRLLAQPAGEG